MFVFLATMTVSELRSQSDTSKLWINRQDALRKLAQADSLPSYKLLVEKKQYDIDILQERITGLQSQIKILNEKDSVTVQKYNEQLIVMKDQRTLFEDQLKGYEKLLRKEKRKRFFTAAAGVVTTGLAAYLYLSK